MVPLRALPTVDGTPPHSWPLSLQGGGQAWQQSEDTDRTAWGRMTGARGGFHSTQQPVQPRGSVHE